MFPLLGLQPLGKVHRLLDSSFVGSWNGMERVGEDIVVIGVDFAHGHDCLVHLVLNDFVIGELFPQNCHLGLESAHLVFVVGFGLIELSFEKIELLSEHVIFMLMDVEVGKSLLINAVDSFKFFRLDFELYSGLSKVSIKLPLEVSGVNHELIVLFRFLLELSRNRVEFDILFIDGLLQESDLFFINIDQIVFSHFQLMAMLVLELLKLA